jgi:hypothetical protein
MKSHISTLSQVNTSKEIKVGLNSFPNQYIQKNQGWIEIQVH